VLKCGRSTLLTRRSKPKAVGRDGIDAAFALSTEACVLSRRAELRCATVGGMDSHVSLPAISMFVATASLLVFAACTSDRRTVVDYDGGGVRDGARPGATIGRECDTSADCGGTAVCTTLYRSPSSGFQDQICTHACTSDPDCTDVDPTLSTSFVCGVGEGGAAVCVPDCVSSRGNVVCDAEGESVACTAAPSSFCEACGCGDPTAPRCAPGVGCMGLSDVGGECRQDDDCRTGNCSTYAGVCRVPVGSPCSATDCDLCTTWTGGSSCTRRCSYDADCNGQQCLGDTSADYFTCRPNCSAFADPSCPGMCRYPRDATQLYCDCSSATCPTLTAPRATGVLCSHDSQCVSDECISTVSTVDGGFTLRYALGWCTVACDSDAACIDGSVCVGTPEGGRCVPVCSAVGESCSYNFDGPRCMSTTHVGGGAILACDPRLVDGSACLYMDDCFSGRCSANRCAPAGGSPNGTACAAGTDCLSGSCQAGSCRGSALLGDACAIPADCAAGTCCTGTCASSC